MTRNGVALAIAPSEVWTSESLSAQAVGSTVLTTDYDTWTSVALVRIAPHWLRKKVKTATGLTLLDEIELVSDSTVRELREQRVRVDDTRLAATKLEYEASTGLLLTAERPESVAAGANKKTRLVYNASHSQPISIENEASHKVTSTIDVGTGLPVELKGPQNKCPLAPCLEGDIRWNTSQLRYDGLGRLVSRWASFDLGTAYVSREVERFQYLDYGGTGIVENRVVAEHRIDVAEPANWTKSLTVLDGLGRTSREQVYTFDTSVPDPVTIYLRDSSGLVRSVETPDPSRTDGARVTTYQDYDGLGRPTRSWHSSGLGGTRLVTYDGLRTEATLLAADSGPAPRTTTVLDGRGRLVRVEEKTSAGTPAVTEYAYDADNNVVGITDADGLVVTMGYDMIGDRRWIQRGGRTWEFTYDRQGRVKTSTVPHAGASTAYTSTSYYDWLGRLVDHLPAPGDLTAQDLADVHFGPIHYTYDQSSASVGAVSSVTSPAWLMTFGYDAAGHATAASQQLTFQGAPTETLSQSATYDALGNVTQFGHPGGASVTYGYDRRGLPRQLTTGSTVVEHVRNPAGLVINRKLNASSPIGSASWTYDAIGRPLQHNVRQVIGPVSVVVASQTNAYFDSGDLRHIDEQIATSARAFDFGYDQQDQIVSAVDNHGYSAAYDYTPAGRLLDVHLSVPTGADVLSRNVFYDPSVPT